MKKTINIYYLYLFFITIITSNSLFSKFVINHVFLYKTGIISIYLIGSLYMILMMYKKKFEFSLFSLSCIFMALYSFLISIINNCGLSDSLISTSWVFCLLFGYTLGKEDDYGIIEKQNLLIYFSLFVIILLFLNNFRINTKERYLSNLIGASHIVYYSVILSAMFILRKNIKAQIIVSFIVMFFAFLSYKRTTMLIVCVGYFIYYLVLFHQMGKLNFRMILLFSLSVFIVFFVINYLSGNVIIKRFKQGFSDGGNGRVDVWVNTLKVYANSSIVKKIFGYGYYRVLSVKGFIHSAHNDFLETLFDYGVVGTIMLLTILISLAQKIYKVKDSILMPAILFSLVIWFFMSSFSHMIFYTVHNVSLLFFLGLMLGYSFNEKMIKEK